MPETQFIGPASLIKESGTSGLQAVNKELIDLYLSIFDNIDHALAMLIGIKLL